MDGNGFHYDFGIAIARGTVQQLALLTGATLSVTAAIYGLITTANQYDETLAKSRVAFGGYMNTIRAMEFAQQKLLDGKTYFDTQDIMQGMTAFQQLGKSAKDSFDMINDMANFAGKNFTETSQAIVSAVQGDMNALRDFGIPEATMRQFAKFEGNTQRMRDAVLGFLKTQKQFKDGFNQSIASIPDFFRRMRGFATLFAQSILGKPTDPNSLVNQLKSQLNTINEFFKAHQDTIRKAGAYIGSILKFILKSVGEFAAWIFRHFERQGKAIEKFFNSYQDKTMSTLLWLELAKGKVISLFQEYKQTIKDLLVLYQAWRVLQLGIAATVFVFNLLRKGWMAVTTAIGWCKLAMEFLADTWTSLSKATLHGIWTMRKWYRNLASFISQRKWTVWVDGMRSAIGRAGDLWTNFSKGLIHNIWKIRNGYRGILSFVENRGWQTWFSNMGTGFQGIRAGLQAATTGAWEFLAAVAANPITWIVVAVIALVAWIYYLYKNWTKVRTQTQGVNDTLLYMLATISPIIGVPLLLAKHWEKFKAIAINSWNTISNLAQLTWLKIKRWANEFWTWFKETVSAVGNWLYDNLWPKDLWAMITQGASSAVDTIVGFFKTIYSYVKPFVDPLVKLFQPIADLFHTISQGVKDLFSSNWIGKILEKLTGVTKAAADNSAAMLAEEQRRQGIKVNVRRGVNAVKETTGIEAARRREQAEKEAASPEMKNPLTSAGIPSGAFDSENPSNQMILQPGAVQIIIHGAADKVRETADEVAEKVWAILQKKQRQLSARMGEG